MCKYFWLILSFLQFACTSQSIHPSAVKLYQHQLPNTQKTHQNIAFGSCSKHLFPQDYWNVIGQQNPDLWIWLGDIVYADTDNETTLFNAYNTMLSNTFYQNFIRKTPVTGIWDDHDFGKNDGGKDFKFKHTSEKLFLNFLNDSSSARNREGIYRNFSLGAEVNKSIELILLDTRFFKDNPEKNNSKLKILGAQQWAWLEETLQKSESPFVLICSGIQVLSNEQPFETWGQFPEERQKLLNLLAQYPDKTILILSGDRHISEFSKIENQGKSIVDFTSSGLTHSYENFTSEKNPYRVQEVYKGKSFGNLQIDWENKNYSIQIISTQGKVIQSLTQKF
jgi:alkaline phosphatase D